MVSVLFSLVFLFTLAEQPLFSAAAATAGRGYPHDLKQRKTGMEMSTHAFRALLQEAGVAATDPTLKNPKNISEHLYSQISNLVNKTITGYSKEVTDALKRKFHEAAIQEADEKTIFNDRLLTGNPVTMTLKISDEKDIKTPRITVSFFIQKFLTLHEEGDFLRRVLEELAPPEKTEEAETEEARTERLAMEAQLKAFEANIRRNAELEAIRKADEAKAIRSAAAAMEAQLEAEEAEARATQAQVELERVTETLTDSEATKAELTAQAETRIAEAQASIANEKKQRINGDWKRFIKQLQGKAQLKRFTAAQKDLFTSRSQEAQESLQGALAELETARAEKETAEASAGSSRAEKEAAVRTAEEQIATIRAALEQLTREAQETLAASEASKAELTAQVRELSQRAERAQASAISNADLEEVKNLRKQLATARGEQEEATARTRAAEEQIAAIRAESERLTREAQEALSAAAQSKERLEEIIAQDGDFKSAATERLAGMSKRLKTLEAQAKHIVAQEGLKNAKGKLVEPWSWQTKAGLGVLGGGTVLAGLTAALLYKNHGKPLAEIENRIERWIVGNARWTLGLEQENN